ncbi:MAG: tRNA (adenosine(37)-N6)-threonylcarbamoyltransferase complex dimerization subunit type 1 TsaB [Thermosynechococcaceae cyanobacterium]
MSIDTTSAALTLALGTAVEAPRIQSWHLERAMSSQMHPLLKAFIEPQSWSDLAWIAVLKGPGSFTGTRMGVVTARTLAQQLQIPLFSWSNLAIAAWIEAVQRGIEDRWVVAVSQPGQRGYLYGAVYEVAVKAGGLIPLSSDRLLPTQDWSSYLDQMPFACDVCLEQPAPAALDSQLLGQSLLTLGWQAWQQGMRPHWQEVLPYYG